MTRLGLELSDSFPIPDDTISLVLKDGQNANITHTHTCNMKNV